MNILMSIICTVVAYHTSRVKSSSTGSLATGDTFYVSMYINITALVFLPPLYNVRIALKGRIINGQLFILYFRDHYD